MCSLNNALGVDLDLAVEMIYSFFVLHNFCGSNKEDSNPDTLQAQLNDKQRGQSSGHHAKIDRLYPHNSHRGKQIRGILCKYF